MNPEPHDHVLTDHTLTAAEETRENDAMEEVASLPDAELSAVEATEAESEDESSGISFKADTATDEPPVSINHYGEPWWDLVNVPTQDNGEPLVDVFLVAPKLRWMEDSPRFNFKRYGLIRESAAYMLRDAQELLPSGLYLQIVGAFRPFATQKAMYERVWSEFKEKHPTWPDETITEYVNVFSAPPIWETPPPHTTGGAVDLSIVTEEGERLDMVSPFEMGWDSAPAFIEGLSDIARANRKMLFDVLSATGLTNFPGEWWHWSYGEPGWALRGGHPHALYGAISDDEIPEWEPPSK